MDKKLVNISAGEINRFTYCPLQWYYTRIYGQKELAARYKELNPGAGGPNPAFLRGQAFHEGYGRRETRKRVIKAVLLLTGVLAAALIYLLCKNPI